MDDFITVESQIYKRKGEVNRKMNYFIGGLKAQIRT